MRCFVFKQKRRKDGKLTLSRLYYGRYRLEDDVKYTEVPLKVSDKQTAVAKLERIVRTAQQERVGIVPPPGVVQAFSGLLLDHLKEFIAELNRLGRNDRYVRQRQAELRRLFQECRWRVLGDIQADAFVKWRQGQTESPKTLNEYLLAANTFIKWVTRSKRLSFENPLQFVEKISEAGKETYHRRPLTEEELSSLIRVSGKRGVVYLTAAHTGLRRNEMRTLVWTDVSLQSDSPFVAVQPGNAKNRKKQPIPLHPEVAEALKKLRAEVRPALTDRVFGDLYPSWNAFRRDLKLAGIKNIDDPNSKVHFHSLRHTLNHRLQENGVVPTMAQHLMRHSNINLTTRTYINASSLPLADALKKVPAILAKPKEYTPIRTPKLVAPSHSESPMDQEFTKTELLKFLETNDFSHQLTLTVVKRHDKEKGARYRVRTCDLSRVKRTLYR